MRMSALYTHKDYKNLRKLMVIAAGCHGCGPDAINGIKDTPEKVIVIYLAQKTFSLSDSNLAVLFSINQKFMQEKLEQLGVELLVNPDYKKTIHAPLEVLKRLEIIDVVNG